MEARVLRWLSLIVTGALSLAFVAGLFLPVYSDEIGWRLQERAGFEGVDKMFSEVCGFNTLAAPPWFMMPARWYSSFFNGVFADPFWIRISGILYAFLWIGLLWQLVRRTTEDRELRSGMLTVGLGLLALGTMPLLMVWSRPEQPIMLAAAAALVLAFADGPGLPLPESTSRQAWLRSSAIVALTFIALSYHVKGLFLLPILLLCLLYASRGSRAHAPRLLAAVLMLAVTASAMSYWSDRLNCPENAILAKAYAGQNLSAKFAHIRSFGEAMALVREMLGNISVFEYVTNIGPRQTPMSSWLARDQIDKATSFQWFLALALAWGAALLLAVATAVVSAFGAVRERRLDPRLVLGAATFGVAIAWSATQAIRNVYESKFVLLLLVLAIVLGLSQRRSEWQRTLTAIIAGLIGIFALVSPFAIAAIYAPSLDRAARQSGFVAEQPYSVSVFGFSKLEPDILATAKLCGIHDPARTHAVMIDDVTYFTFIHSHLPQHELGVLRGWNGDIADPLGYLRSRRSDGVVVSCDHLTPALRKGAKSVGRFCCLDSPAR